MVWNYVICCLLVGLITFCCSYFWGKLSKQGLIGFTIVVTIMTIPFLMCLGIIGQIYIETHAEKYEWTPVYDKSCKVMYDSSNEIDIINVYDELMYRFVIVNKEGLLEYINTPLECIEKIEICGVKHSFVPVKHMVCSNPNFLAKHFCIKEIKIIPEHPHGKLVVDEDTYIRSLTYKLIEE